MDSEKVGRKSENIFICFDEAIGIDSNIWEAAAKLFCEENNPNWIKILAPTDTYKKDKHE